MRSRYLLAKAGPLLERAKAAGLRLDLGGFAYPECGTVILRAGKPYVVLSSRGKAGVSGYFCAPIDEHTGDTGAALYFPRAADYPGPARAPTIGKAGNWL